MKAPWSKQDQYHREFGDQIIDQIKRGVAPWQKPWKPGERIMPENLQTGKRYSGGNSIYLAAQGLRKGHGDNRWGTYRQIAAAGGQVRKRERGVKVLFYGKEYQKPLKDKEGAPVKDKDGNQVYQSAERAAPFVRLYTVFNVEQADGLKLERREGKTPPEWQTHQDAERMIRASDVPVSHVSGDRAYYNMDRDQVVLPERGQFPTETAYYQTAMHELGHATGHPDRMNRQSLQEGLDKGFGSPEYAREELRAEISAMMTGDQVGVGHDGSRGAAYVENWVKVVEEDPREIHRAASEARRMTDYLVSRGRELGEREAPHKENLTQKYSHEMGPQISRTPSPQPAQAQELERDAGPSR